ncbi:MAG: PDZ domain-containing protein [Planctomycetales bacterium]|nr:PDZ domain-containing protein [Planctomycetales bacterium]
MTQPTRPSRQLTPVSLPPAHPRTRWLFAGVARRLLVVCSLCGLWWALAGHSAAQDLLQAEEIAFQQAVQVAAGSVVQIETFGGLERVGQELIAEGPTTGTIVGAEGWIISSLFNFRQQPASILVTLPDGKRLAARIVGRDYSRELVLLKVESEAKLPLPQFAPQDDLRVGQWTIALGKTYDKQSVSQSVGIVSALGRAYDKAIQTDAKVSPINYGGPLIDLQGRVIGILSPISPGTFLEGDSSQLYDSGIGFAIPMEDILTRLPKLQAGEDVHSGKLGIVTSEQNELVGPVRITGAAPGSPAAKSALRAGDVIVQAGGSPVSLLAHLRHALGPIDAGQSLPLVVEREGQRLTVNPVLVEEIPVYRRRYLGLRLGSAKQALEIIAVEPNSPAADSGLAVGQRITHCNGQLLQSPEEFLALLAVQELDSPLNLEVAAAEQEPRQIDLRVTTWPSGLPTSLPAIDQRIEESMQTEVVDVILGDFPNKAFALIPPLSDSRALGLLVIFPEPGERDRDKTLAYWSAFCRDYGWIVAVIQAGNPRAWSREEVELAGRVIGRLDKNYEIDKRRTVIGGLGIGGRIALAAAASELPRVAGAMTLGTELSRLGWPQSNAPLQSIDFLLAGEVKPLAAIAEQLSERGYAANVVAAAELDVGVWETLPTQQIHLWLEGLGRW